MKCEGAQGLVGVCVGVSVSVSENTWYGNTWCGNTWERTQRTHLVVVRHHGSVDRDDMSVSVRTLV